MVGRLPVCAKHRLPINIILGLRFSCMYVYIMHTKFYVYNYQSRCSTSTLNLTENRTCHPMQFRNLFCSLIYTSISSKSINKYTSRCRINIFLAHFWFWFLARLMSLFMYYMKENKHISICKTELCPPDLLHVAPVIIIIIIIY